MTGRDCGTLGAYRRHVRAGVPYGEIDAACRDAMADYQSAWFQALKARTAGRRRREGRKPWARREDPTVVPPSRPVDLVLAAAGCVGNGMDARETAALLGVSVDRVRSLIADGRRTQGGVSCPN